MMGKAYDYIEMKIPAKTEYVGVIRLTYLELQAEWALHMNP